MKMKKTIVRRKEMALVWEQKGGIYKAVPLKDITEGMYNNLTNFFGFSPVGRTEEFMKLTY